jgi:DDE superfamily endonuclease
MVWSIGCNGLQPIDETVLMVAVLVAVVMAAVNVDRLQPVIQHNSELTGAKYFAEIMDTENVHRFRSVARMDKETFVKLNDLLRDVGGLENSMYICTGQMAMIYIQVLRGQTVRIICERWQHSSDTISKIVHNVSDALIRCGPRIFKPAKIGDPVQPQIGNFSKFSPFFDNCIGALDGSHIPAVIPIDKQGPFRNRKKFISQNVLGVANFDLTYAYGLFGWEGSAHDSRVYDDAKDKGLPLIPGKYYLGDAGYGLSNNVLTPFRGVRYHLREFDINGHGPENAKELFNLRHSSLRNVVERIFGVSKRRFPVLCTMRPYSFEFQTDIVQCCFLLHNFVHLNQSYEDQFYDDDGNLEELVLDDDELPDEIPELNYNALKAWRNGIADAMWAHYQLAGEG